MGSCAVTFVENLLRLAANETRNPRVDTRSARLALEEIKMEDNFYSWKFAYERGVTRCKYAECVIEDQEILEIAVNNLSGLVFPTVKRDFYLKLDERYADLTNLESLWAVLETEYVLYLRTVETWVESIDPKSKSKSPKVDASKADKEGIEQFEGFAAAMTHAVSKAITQTETGTKRPISEITSLR